MTDKSRIPGFYKKSVSDRVAILREREYITEVDSAALLGGGSVLTREQADRMVENVVGVFSLPMGLGLNFLINGRAYIVPLVVEEPSIIAALSSAAKLVRAGGGFTVESTDPVLIGQIQVVGFNNTSKAREALLQNKNEIINLANGLHPNMVARGGGVKDVEVRVLPQSCAKGDMVVVHLLVDTRDAMGANLVNSMCEGVAALVEKITGGEVFLRILSNLTDRSMVHARCVIPVSELEGNNFSGEQVRDGVVLANAFAAADPYRAATHNKGIMNGIDAVALATGNDWRAIEAAAHAYAARGGRYTSLTSWSVDDEGNLVGELSLPLKVGTVGGPLQSNPAVAIAHRILNVERATELAEVMGAVGLAQNFSAIRALSTEGIQQGHMTLHARTVANAAGAPPEIFERVVEELIESGDIKVWKAEEIVARLQSTPKGAAERAQSGAGEKLASGHGKVIFLGEHAVVYGSHALAASLPLAIQAKVRDGNDGIHVVVPRWGVETKLEPGVDHKHSLYTSLERILDALELRTKSIRLEIYPHVPRAMGLGGSAAIAVAVVRALDEHFSLGLNDTQVSEIAYESEKVAHGRTSGIDNTLAAHGGLILYKTGEPPTIQKLSVETPFDAVIGISGIESLTAKMVSQVHEAWKRNTGLYERIFQDIDALSLQGAEALQKGDLRTLGELMNVNQGLLNALQVSTPELEEMVGIARRAGALGAKLTGGGGGGSMIALCPDDAEGVKRALERGGYKALVTRIGGEENR
ncbi:MAG: hydroxymethylglutaryl-CoA reductase, degradative [Myxococcota bacterium]